MLECIFTIDYEIYGNGEGSLHELVFEPAKQLKAIFDKKAAKFVIFVEAAEFEQIDAFQTDPGIDQVKKQIRELHGERFEIALHLHPQWCNGKYQDSKWHLDYGEYNLCTLSKKRVTEIVQQSIAYLRRVLASPDFTPSSFRAGNWLFQPTATAAQVLAEHGIRTDSSVFKGGLLRKHNLDYRRAHKNGFYWTFRRDVSVPDPTGSLLEIPIYTKMVPFWQMITAKRLGLQRKSNSNTGLRTARFHRVLDLLRFRQPLKFDFCRMTLEELVLMIKAARQEDQRSPEVLKPLVAIGHTKDLVDFEAVTAFLSYLQELRIPISTLEDVSERCRQSLPGAA